MKDNKLSEIKPSHLWAQVAYRLAGLLHRQICLRMTGRCDNDRH
nr:MAG TPA: hypothetical protein [Caudoviricetes sp.]